MATKQAKILEILRRLREMGLEEAATAVQKLKSLRAKKVAKKPTKRQPFKPGTAGVFTKNEEVDEASTVQTRNAANKVKGTRDVGSIDKGTIRANRMSRKRDSKAFKAAASQPGFKSRGPSQRATIAKSAAVTKKAAQIKKAGVNTKTKTPDGRTRTGSGADFSNNNYKVRQGLARKK
jgi:hypothetical protein